MSLKLGFFILFRSLTHLFGYIYKTYLT